MTYQDASQVILTRVCPHHPHNTPSTDQLSAQHLKASAWPPCSGDSAHISYKLVNLHHAQDTCSIYQPFTEFLLNLSKFPFYVTEYMQLSVKSRQ